jgi:hypothetical protein
MSLILFLLVVVIILVLLVWAVDQLGLTQPFNGIIKALIILIGVVLILQKAGYL